MLAWRRRDYRWRLAVLNVYVWIGLLATLAPFVLTTIAEPHGVSPLLATPWHSALVVSVATFALAVFARRETPGAASHLRVQGLVLAVVVAAALVWTDIRASAEFTFEGLTLVAVRDPLWADLAESQRLLSKGFWFVVTTYTGLVLVWPVVLARTLWQSRVHTDTLLPVAVAALAGTVLALLQVRFALFLMVPFAALLGHTFEDLLRRILSSPADGPLAGGARRLAALAVAAGFAAALAPSLSVVNFAPSALADPAPELRDTITWLRRHTPATSPSATAPDDYAIAADWEYGHFLVFFAQRPVVASPLGYPEPVREGVRDGAAAMVYPPDAALRILDERRVRYVIVPPPAAYHAARIAYWDPRTRAYPPDFDENSVLGASLASELLRGADLTSRPAAETLSKFRLVYERWPGTGREFTDVPALAIYERVSGVTVVGRAVPSAIVRASAQVRTAQGRQFPYRREVRAAADGSFRLTLPYAGGSQAYSSVGLAEPYRIESAGSLASLAPTEVEVLTGATMAVDLSRRE
jgi:asparagine N-glycosylation enzyme membrane subunit Stt3